MATTTKAAIVSVRLTAREKSGLDADARMKGIPSGTAAAAYIAEGVRRSRFPAIDFRDGQPGRVAYLAGSRWPVWMIVELMRELDGDLGKAVKLILKPAALVRMALAYADAYPQEIKDGMALAAGRDYAGMKRKYPTWSSCDDQTAVGCAYFAGSGGGVAAANPRTGCEEHPRHGLGGAGG